MTPIISPHVAATTLWYYGIRNADVPVGAYPPSRWRSQLLDLIDGSDPENRAKLSLTFPGEVAAVEIIKNHPRGDGLLRAILAEDEVTT